MRKYAITFLLLCLYGLARGQTEGYSCYYWFDDDYASLRTVTSPTDHWQMMADVSGLSESLHTIHIIVRDSEGRQSLPKTQLFMHTTELSEQSVAYYWFDSQQGKPLTSPMLQGSFDVDVSTLSDGIHTFHYMVARNDGSTSVPTVNYFVKLPQADTAIKGYYWFDTQTDVHEVAVTNGTFEVDASSLSDGFHRFHYQALLSSGTTSKPTASFFLKTAQVNAGDELNCICTVDGQLRHIEKLSNQGGVIHWDLDMHDLTDGLHRIQLQTVTESGAMSGSYTSYFMRVTTPEELGDMRCLYAIDDAAFNTDASLVGSNGNYHFVLDLSALSDGLHYISYMLYNDRGTSTKIQTRFFLKVPLGGNSIGQYQYWLNDDDISEAKTVTLAKKVNPLQLMSLLPVESRPLRSSQFLFDVSSGQPKVYAKNTIHLRFYDAAMRFTDATKDYADYSVGQNVCVIKELESGVRETTEWPEENEIKWYQVTAERGDSLSFKTDLAATLQLFSPSGKEVYSASGSEVVKWGGCHAEENGTFYLALHDVTATQGDSISIDYEHIDRYAVLRQDLMAVGNVGSSTITFEGNGFDELTTVDLVLGSNVITSVEVGHESNTSTSVKFDFTGAALGQYKAVFHFEDGELAVEKCVTVEEPRDIKFAISVSYNSQFMKWDANKYEFEINNLGNTTAYEVPIGVFIYAPDSLCLTKVDIGGYNMKKHYKEVLGELCTDSLETVIAKEESNSGDKMFFVKLANTKAISGNPYLHWASIIPNLRPGINNISVSVKVDDTHRIVFASLTVPKEWENEPIDIAGARFNEGNYKKECIKNTSACQKYYNYYLQTGDDSMLDGCIKQDKECQTTSGAQSMSVEPGDPNDIFGYAAESGSHAVKDGQSEVYYTIEFENDPEIATAPAHEIIVTDTLDAQKFDLSTFKPTRVRIGEKSAELTGDRNFVTTIDMRPEINAIAQVEGTFDQKKGIARWHISSLDPMTMEPTDDVMQGVLPVNVNGNGMGELMFDISLKHGLAHGTAIGNRAAIVFDQNDAIMTPTWTNTIDRVKPVSRVTDVTLATDSTAMVSIAATDEDSGPWRYDVYVQYGSGAWFLAAENVAAGTTATVRIYEGIEHHFYSIATDMAGNVEQKDACSEVTYSYSDRLKGDINGDGNIDVADISSIISFMAGSATTGLAVYDVNGDGKVDVADISSVLSIMAARARAAAALFD